MTQEQLDEALFEGSRTGERIGEVVIRRGLAGEEDVARLLAEQWELEYVERSAIWFDPNALALMSREDAQRLEALPTRIEGGHVVVAVAEPTEERREALRDVIGEDNVVIVVPKSALDAGLRSQLLASRGESSAERKVAVKEDSPVPEEEDLPPAAEVDEEADGTEKPKAGRRLAAVTLLRGGNGDQEDAAGSDADDGDDVGGDVLAVDESADAVVALAAEAREVAERLAAQAAAVVKAQAGAQAELRRQTKEFEERVEALERKLEENARHLEESERKLEENERKLEESEAKVEAARGRLRELVEGL
jgi:MshEN domain